MPPRVGRRQLNGGPGSPRQQSAAEDHLQEDLRRRARRPSRRRVEGRLRRFRDRDDGVLPAAVAARRDDGKAAQGHRRLFRADADGHAFAGYRRTRAGRRRIVDLAAEDRAAVGPVGDAGDGDRDRHRADRWAPADRLRAQGVAPLAAAGHRRGGSQELRRPAPPGAGASPGARHAGEAGQAHPLHHDAGRYAHRPDGRRRFLDVPARHDRPRSAGIGPRRGWSRAASRTPAIRS